MIKYKFFLKPFILLLLASLVLMSFSWNPKLYLVVFLVAVFSFVLIENNDFIIKSIYAKVIIFIFTVNILSVLSAKTMALPIDYSFVIQIFLFPFILLGINLLYLKYPVFFNNYFKYIFYILFSLLILQIGVNFYYYGFKHLTSFETILFTDVYNFANISNEVLGTQFKGMIPWITFLSLLVVMPSIAKFKKIIFFILIILSTLIVGAKANLIGIFGTLYFMSLLQFRYRLFRLSILYLTIIGTILVIYSNFDLFNTIMILDGRYYVPILTSEDFWTHPFGIGMGNYTYAALNNIYNIDTGGIFPPVWIHTDMVDKFGWFPVAEADPILLMVSFGWIPYLIYLIVVALVIHYHTAKAKIISSVNKQGFYIFVMLFFSGLFQDWFNVHAYWVFFGLSIAMMTNKERVIS